MTFKKERNKKAKQFRKLFKVDFVASFKAAKTNLSLDLVHPSLQQHSYFEDCYCGYTHLITKVIATDGNTYNFVDGFLF